MFSGLAAAVETTLKKTTKIIRSTPTPEDGHVSYKCRQPGVALAENTGESNDPIWSQCVASPRQQGDIAKIKEKIKGQII